MLLESPRGLHHFADIVELGGFEFADRFSRVLTVELFEQGFVVEGVDMGRSAIHVEEDDVLGLRGVVGFFRGEGIGGIVVRSLRGGLFAEEGGKGDGPESASGLA